MTISQVGVLGCGLMGSGIAEVCARAGMDVVVVETDTWAAEKGRQKVFASLDQALGRGRLTDEQHEHAIRNLRFSDDLRQLADRELVIEAVAEDLGIKLQAFKAIDEVLELDDSIVATNTSSIPIVNLAASTRRPENVIGVHFFNPVPVLPLVELVPSLLTSKTTIDRVESFVEEDLGKSVITSQDRAGFIVNALLIPYLLSAIRMLESGFATAEDIDTGMVQGCAHPMGPLALADLIGLDTTMAVADSMYAEFKEPLFASPPLLSRMVEARLLGRKSNQGFYRYEP